MWDIPKQHDRDDLPAHRKKAPSEMEPKEYQKQKRSHNHKLACRCESAVWPHSGLVRKQHTHTPSCWHECAVWLEGDTAKAARKLKHTLKLKHMHRLTCRCEGAVWPHHGESRDFSNAGMACQHR